MLALRAFFRTKVYLWVVLLITAIILLVGIAGAASGFLASNLSFIGVNSSSNRTQAVHAMEKREEVAILALSVTDIYDKTNSRELFGRNIFGSSSTAYIKGTFTAKLGFDGRDVKVREIRKDTYEVYIPEFKVIGTTNSHFEQVIERNGVLSFLTPDVDILEAVNGAKSEDTLSEYIEQNQRWLEDAAENYFNNLVGRFDTDIRLEFIFGKSEL